MRKFTVIDEGFTCIVCSAQVPPLGYTSRNHCRECLCSLHLDNNPGDRQSDCGADGTAAGVLRPVGIERSKKGMQIIHRCDKCGEIRKNIAADDDDYDVIVKLSAVNLYK